MSILNKYKCKFICIIMILLCLSTYLIFCRIDFIDITQQIDDKNQDIKDLEWIFIKSIIYEDYLAAKSQAKVVASDLTEQLMLAYPNLDDLRYELDNFNTIESPRYAYIMRKAIQDKYLFGLNNDQNDIFICDIQHVLMNISLSTAFSKDKPNDWNFLIDHDINPVLARHAHDMIFAQSNRLIYWERCPEEHWGSEHSQLPAEPPSIDSLYKVYMEFGIEGFKHVQCLAPAYITTTGDIFGVNDVDMYGNRIANHKIVVIQTFNLYQQIMNRYSQELMKFNTLKEKMVNEPRQHLYSHAMIIFIIITIIFALIYGALILNENIFNKK